MKRLWWTRYIDQGEYETEIAHSPITLVSAKRSTHFILAQLRFPFFLISPASLRDPEKFQSEIYDLTPIRPKPPPELFTLLGTSLDTKRKRLTADVRLNILPFLLYNAIAENDTHEEAKLRGYVRDVIDVDGSRRDP